MNYYEHHIGDYAQATAHLSFVEDAAYSRLIRKYYAEEKPLPADPKAVQRLTGARTKEERQAITDMLAEFFVLEADGWHNKRCDAEVARYLDKQTKARASADARWAKRTPNAMRTHSENDANASVEKHANALPTQSEGNAHQAPSTKHQTPDTSLKSNNSEQAAAATAHAAGKKSPPPRSVEIVVLLRSLEKSRGKACKATSTDPRVIGWAERGISDAQIKEAHGLAVDDRARGNDPSPIGPGFLDVFLAKLINPAVDVQSIVVKPKAWHEINANVEAKGKEHGLHWVKYLEAGKPWLAYKTDVLKAAGVTE